MKRLLLMGIALGACVALGVRVMFVSAVQAAATSEALAWQASVGPFTGTASVLVEGEADAIFAGRLGEHPSLPEIVEAVHRAPLAPSSTRYVDLLLDGIVSRYSVSWATARSSQLSVD